ncbi:NgoPII family restriction endonuclease [Candidatus Dojkabacteria bacterium]|nr:NgoPII family restriction endonuclease [Candidatus Dojkabacteria bacterium]
MCPNILTAIKNISNFRNNNMSEYFKDYAGSQIKTVRQQMENYVKDAISGSFNSVKNKKPTERYNGVFSYIGNKNQPPDMIIQNGDAIVIKTIKTYKGSFTINNSPPKDRLMWNDPWIIKNCRRIDGGQWNNKDLFYVIAWIEKRRMKYLNFIQGSCIFPEQKFYNKKIHDLKNNIYNYLESEGLEANRTIALGKVTNIDPLGITNLRIKTVWRIKNPLKIFSDTFRYDNKREFTLIALMLKNKFDTFPKKDIDAIVKDKQIEIEDVKIKNPNNPKSKIDAKLVIASW